MPLWKRRAALKGRSWSPTIVVASSAVASTMPPSETLKRRMASLSLCRDGKSPGLENEHTRSVQAKTGHATSMSARTLVRALMVGDGLDAFIAQTLAASLSIQEINLRLSSRSRKCPPDCYEGSKFNLRDDLLTCMLQPVGNQHVGYSYSAPDAENLHQPEWHLQMLGHLPKHHP